MCENRTCYKMLKSATNEDSRSTLRVNQTLLEVCKCLLIITADFEALY